MSKSCHRELDQDLTPHFRWRWKEHGIYAGVCSTLGLFVLTLYLLPASKPRGLRVEDFAYLRADNQARFAAGPIREEGKGQPAVRHKGAEGIHPLKGDLARNAGILGVLNAKGAAASMFGRDTADASPLGSLVGSPDGQAYRTVGLGLVGSGAGSAYAGRAAGPAHRYGLRAPALAESPTSLHTPTVDPNGRFATTYRPGHGHLDWFDAELTRSQVPPQIRELVGDVGSRYAPAMPAPVDRALAQRIDLERTALPPGGGPVSLRIALRSTKERVDHERLRPPLSVHVVLDVSGSMEGAPLAQAKQAVQQLLRRLGPSDRFSLTTFHTSAQVIVPDGTVGPRQEMIRQRLAGIRSEGSTNMVAGLDLAYGEARRQALSPEWVSLVMVLSDGYPNVGEALPEALSARAAEAFQSGVQTSAFGVSDQHDGLLMSQIAERGAGAYYYLPNIDAIPSALATELDSRLQPVAQAVEVRVRLAPDVKLTSTHGSRRLDARESAQVSAQERAVDAQVAHRDHITRDRMRDVEGGMRFFIPGFVRDDQHVILLGLQVPPGVGQRALATVELRYKDRLRRNNAEERQSVQASYAASDAASVASLDHSVAATLQAFAAGEALVTASGYIGTIENARASGILAERAELLRKAATTLHEPRLASDAARLDRLRHVISGGQVADPLLLAQLLSHSGQGLLH